MRALLYGLGQIESFLCAAMGLQLRHSGSPSVFCFFAGYLEFWDWRTWTCCVPRLCALATVAISSQSAPNCLSSCSSSGCAPFRGLETDDSFDPVAIFQELLGILTLVLKLIWCRCSGTCESQPRRPSGSFWLPFPS